MRDAAKNVLKWTSKTAGVVSSSDLGSGQETLEYFVQVSDSTMGVSIIEVCTLQVRGVNKKQKTGIVRIINAERIRKGAENRGMEVGQFPRVLKIDFASREQFLLRTY